MTVGSMDMRNNTDTAHSGDPIPARVLELLPYTSGLQDPWFLRPKVAELARRLVAEEREACAQFLHARGERMRADGQVEEGCVLQDAARDIRKRGEG